MPTLPSATRRPSIDLMRFVAAFGIVWAHMQAPGMAEGYVALALFLILTAFLSLRSLLRGGERRFWLGRLVRFALPWLVWSGAFLGLRVIRFGPEEALSPGDPWRLLIGPEIHLWFLPFVLVASPLVPAAARLLGSARAVWIAAALLIPAGLGALWLHDRGGLPEPLAQWAFALVPSLYGLLSASGQRHGAVGGPLLFATGACLGASLLWGSLAAPFILGACLLFEAVWRLPLGSAWAMPLGQLAFGIYLTHPAVMLVWYRTVPDGPAAAGALAVFALSAAAAWLIRRLPGGRLIA